MNLVDMATILRGVAFQSLACARSYRCGHKAPRSILEVDGGWVVMSCRGADVAVADGLGVIVK